MAAKKKRIGIVTGGGDCPGLNAVIRGAVHRLLRHYDAEVYGSEDSYNGLLKDPQRVRRLDLQAVSGILSKGGTILGTTNRGDPYHFPLRRPDGGTDLVDVSAKLKQRILEHGLDGIISIGGDGSLALAKRLMDDHGIPMIGVPKTIDNDVPGTDFTFGFWTAAQTATSAIDMLHTTAESHDRVMVVEIMGRHAGHLALTAGVAGGADVILIPEIPYDIDAVIRKIEERRSYGLTFSIIAVAEGAFPKGGQISTEHLPDDQAKGRLVKLGGIGRFVAEQIADRTACETRVTVLGHLQRGGTPVAFDRTLSTMFGVAAADAAMRGDWGKAVVLRTPDVVTVPLEELIKENLKVDLGSSLVAAARGVGICLGDG